MRSGEPSGHRRFVVVTGGDTEHQVNGFVSGDFQIEAVEGREQGERLPGQSLVPVGEGMVLGYPDGEYGCFVGELGVELDVAEPGVWGVQR